jgi:hypothetical protein
MKTTHAHLATHYLVQTLAQAAGFEAPDRSVRNPEHLQDALAHAAGTDDYMYGQDCLAWLPQVDSTEDDLPGYGFFVPVHSHSALAACRASRLWFGL